jgi:microcystin-dependent protein
MPAHTHAAATSSSGEHQHSLSRSSYGYDFPNIVQSGDPNKSFQGTVKTTAAGAHTHVVTVAPAGGGKPFENRPPYYVLAYIMYTGK